MSHLECSLVRDSTRVVKGYAGKSNICISTMRMCPRCVMFLEEVVQFRGRKESLELEASCEAYRGKNEPQPTFNLEVGTRTTVSKKQSLVTVEIKVQHN